jgi:hypothetical protein
MVSSGSQGALSYGLGHGLCLLRSHGALYPGWVCEITPNGQAERAEAATEGDVMNDVERVARAIYESYQLKRDWDDPKLAAGWRPACRKAAVAAIRLIRTRSKPKPAPKTAL